ncbi:hypothetical protein [Stutzerimonas kirkiae]|uniref:hypothetical protein n=1 Tax=Stutzerimonas kirkiae TaxID=2211392 RepID=UPI0010370F68|nr:hypothetical protein [Stutzerimonas kirkiae]
MTINKPLKNVGEAASARQKQAKKRSLRIVNEHSEPVFNAAMATQVVFKRLVRGACAAVAHTPTTDRGETDGQPHEHEP